VSAGVSPDATVFWERDKTQGVDSRTVGWEKKREKRKRASAPAGQVVNLHVLEFHVDSLAHS
jgi:hypothetical protein